jgi:hypothetical protein|uniref:Uncharacterized protein n=1 Tax=viral metagenome TaxID=1070528 RepID=A0A6C0DGQ9_9ZZZZ
MIHKTRKHSNHGKGVYSIPELRRSFEHIEAFVDEKLKSKDSKDKISKDLRKEWMKVFNKPLDKKSADAFLEDRMSKSSRRIRHTGGGLLEGAPVEYSQRAGLYLAPSGLPGKDGGLPESGQTGGGFGSFIQYVSTGFSNPEIAQTYDPVPGQAKWPVPFLSTGSNQAGGRRKSRRKIRGGSIGAMLSQAFTRPIPSDVPPGPLQDAQDMFHGKEVGASPDQVQRTPDYQLGSVYPKPVNL